MNVDRDEVRRLGHAHTSIPANADSHFRTTKASFAGVSETVTERVLVKRETRFGREERGDISHQTSVKHQVLRFGCAQKGCLVDIRHFANRHFDQITWTASGDVNDVVRRQNRNSGGEISLLRRSHSFIFIFKVVVWWWFFCRVEFQTETRDGGRRPGQQEFRGASPTLFRRSRSLDLFQQLQHYNYN